MPPSVTPDKGDKVSWTWNSSQPSGTVSEKKEQGEAAVTSKRGNTIKKHAEPGDPAIAISRPGNDVVKNASELEVEEKHPDNEGGGAEANGEEESDEDAEPEEPDEEDAKEEKAKTTPAKNAGKRKHDAVDAADDEAATADDEAATADDESAGDELVVKKARGRPKGSTNKSKAEARARAEVARRGRKPKAEKESKEKTSTDAPKKRGRKPKEKSDDAPEPEPKGKGGKKLAGAAKQAAEEKASGEAPKKRGRPRKDASSGVSVGGQQTAAKVTKKKPAKEAKPVTEGTRKSSRK